MPRYFYILDYVMDARTRAVERLSGYYTDDLHRTRGEPNNLTRDEALHLLSEENILFLLDGCYRRVHLRRVEVDGQAYLRIDSFAHPADYMG